MKTRYTVALSMLAGAALGAGALQGLHAQATPPIYYVAEIDVTNVDAYTKEYAPKAQALIKAHGGRILAAGQKVTSIEGEPPKQRVAIQDRAYLLAQLSEIQAWRSSAEYKELRKIGDLYAKFRAFTIEGLAQPSNI